MSSSNPFKPVSVPALKTFISKMRTKSVKQQLDALNEFFRINTELYDKEIFDPIFEEFEQAKLKMSEEGHRFAQKKAMKFPQFKANFGESKDGKVNKLPCHCEGCGQNIVLPTAAFFMVVRGLWTVWHAIPECFPPKFATVMENNSSYCKWKMPK